MRNTIFETNSLSSRQTQRERERETCQLQGAELLLLGEMSEQGMHWLRPGQRTKHDRCRQFYTLQKCFLSVIRWGTGKTWLTHWSRAVRRPRRRRRQFVG